MNPSSPALLSAAVLNDEQALLTQIVRPLERLLANGCAIIADKSLRHMLQGLAYPCDDGRHWLASQRLLQGVAELGSDAQMVAALLATDAQFHQPWLAMLAARCQEAAKLSDPLQLVDRISQLDGASEWVESALSKASLSTTSYPQLERELFGATAEQITTLPSLIRVVAMAHKLSLWQKAPLAELKPVSLNSGRPDLDWVAGRLLPTSECEVKYSPYLLHELSLTQPGNRFVEADFLALPIDAHKQRADMALDWVLSSPWALLLTAIMYEQDIWASEGQSGLVLELPAGQNPYKPSLVNVLVLNQYGDEVLCGSFAQFITRILTELSMTLFPAVVSDNALNRQLGEVIERLMRRQVWQHRDGVGGDLDSYKIAPHFADACYRMKGQRAFALYGKTLRSAIRTQATRWRQEQQTTQTPSTSARL